MQQYELMPGQKYNGRWHREGFDEEDIICGGCYYFDKSLWFNDNDKENDIFEIMTESYAQGCHVKIKQYQQSMKIKNENVFIFNNQYLNHKLSKLENKHKDKILKRCILCFFLVKPQQDINIEKESKKEEEEEEEEEDEYEREQKEIRKGILSSNDIMVNKHFKYGVIINNWFRISFDGKIVNNYRDYEMLMNIIVDYTIFSLSKQIRLRDELRKKRLRPTKSSGLGLHWVSVAN